MLIRLPARRICNRNTHTHTHTHSHTYTHTHSLTHTHSHAHTHTHPHTNTHSHTHTLTLTHTHTHTHIGKVSASLKCHHLLHPEITLILTVTTVEYSYLLSSPVRSQFKGHVSAFSEVHSHRSVILSNNNCGTGHSELNCGLMNLLTGWLRL